MSGLCPVCFSSDAIDLVRLEGVPALTNVPQRSFEAARAVPCGNMNVVACAGCGHVYNRTFGPGLIEYRPGYENSLMFSPKLRRYAEAQAADLVARPLDTIVVMSPAYLDEIRAGTRALGIDARLLEA